MTSTSVEIDGNAWYQVIETRVDFNSSMVITGNKIMFVGASPNANQYWMFYKLSNGNYAIRNKYTSQRQQMGACYVAAEKSESKTQPCMVTADGGDQSQEWIITNWGDDTYKFVNAKNGTGYNLDWHAGNPGFLNPVTAATPYQPAQHWKISSLTTINDGAYSTALPALAAATSSSSPAQTTSGSSKATSTAPSRTGSSQSIAASTANASSQSNSAKSSSGLSAAAGAGIGVGVSIVAIAAILGLIILFRRRRKNNRIPKNGSELEGNMLAQSNGHQNWPVYAKEVPKEAPGHEMSHEMYSPPAELAGNNTPLGSPSPEYYVGKR